MNKTSPDLENLQVHLSILATLSEADALLISCYVRLNKGVQDRQTFEEQTRRLISSLSGQARQDFEDALDPIRGYLAHQLLPDAKGAAFFSRAGSEPFFLPLQFQIPLPNWIAIDTVPNIFHLVELKDTYHRYVVVLSTKESARIIEVNLGAVTEELWKRSPDLRKDVGREWGRERYQNHRRDRGQKFIKEKIKILSQLISAGGHSHLILAGHPAITGRVRKALPKSLLAKLFDVVPISGKAPLSDVLETTLASFVEAEEKESQAVAETLLAQIRTGGLAVVGAAACFRALSRSQVDILVISRTYSPGRASACTACYFLGSERESPPRCPACGYTKMNDIDVKEEMVRIAEKKGCMVEIVNESEALTQLGGVGALLRYRPPDEYV